MLKVKFLSKNASLPVKCSELAAGFDLTSPCDCVVKAMDRQLVPTDIALCVPKGTYGRIAPRSGLAYKHGIDTLAGVIDGDYLGNVGVILYNTTKEDFVIKKGDRIAQLILERYESDCDVCVVDALDPTARNEGGFGSTNDK